MGQNTDFAVRRSGTTMPGRRSGDQVHKVKENCRAIDFIFTLRYQATPIHTPLTLAAAGGSKPGVIASVHAKMFRKKFTAMFQVVQHMMGQGDKDAIARVNLPRTRPLPALPLFVQRGKKSTLLYDSPLCRGHA